LPILDGTSTSNLMRRGMDFTRRLMVPRLDQPHLVVSQPVL
jgi:hypothetical protein